MREKENKWAEIFFLKRIGFFFLGGGGDSGAKFFVGLFKFKWEKKTFKYGERERKRENNKKGLIFFGTLD